MKQGGKSQTSVIAFTWAKIITNLDSVDAFRAPIGEGDKGKRLFTYLPNVRTQFA